MSRFIIWVTTYLSILIYSAVVGWVEGIKKKKVLQQRHGRIDEMEKEKSIPDWVLDQSAMFASLLGFMLHLRTLYTLHKVTQQALDKDFLTKGWITLTVCGHWSYREIRIWINWQFYGLVEKSEKWMNGQIDGLFFTCTFSHPLLLCVFLQAPTTHGLDSSRIQGKKMSHALSLRPVNSIIFSVLYWIPSYSYFNLVHALNVESIILYNNTNMIMTFRL